MILERIFVGIATILSYYHCCMMIPERTIIGSSNHLQPLSLFQDGFRQAFHLQLLPLSVMIIVWKSFQVSNYCNFTHSMLSPFVYNGIRKDYYSTLQPTSWERRVMHGAMYCAMKYRIWYQKGSLLIEVLKHLKILEPCSFEIMCI